MSLSMIFISSMTQASGYVFGTLLSLVLVGITFYIVRFIIFGDER